MGELSSFYDSTVKVERYVTDGKTPTGQPKTELKVIIQKLDCTTQSDSGKLFMASPGKTNQDLRIMYCDLVDIKSKDIITILTAPSNANVGNKYFVTQVNDFGDPDLGHLEINLESGG